MVHDVYISHVTGDKPVADAVCAGLEAVRIRCWIASRDTLPGEDRAQAIVEAISGCQVMVLVFSKSASLSKDVAKELTVAMSAKVIVIPFRIDDAPLQGVMQYYLADTHWLDALNPPTEQQIEQLGRTVKRFLQAESATDSEQVIDLLPTATRAEPIESAASSPSVVVQVPPPGDAPSGFGVPVRRLWRAVVALVLLGGAWLWWGSTLPPGAPSAPAGTMSTSAEQASPVTVAPAAPAQPLSSPTVAPPEATPKLPDLLPLSPQNVSRLSVRTILGPYPMPGTRSSVPGSRSIAFSPDWKLLAFGTEDRNISLREVPTGGEVRTIVTGYSQTVGSIAFSPDGKTLASTSNSKNTTELWDLADGDELRSFRGGAQGVAFSPDGKILATANGDKLVLWDVGDGREIRTLQVHTSSAVTARNISSVVFSPDGNTLAAGKSDSTVTLWEAVSGKELRVLPSAGLIGPLLSLSFSPDGNLLAAGSQDKMVKLWNLGDGSEVFTLGGHTNRVSSLFFSSDGKLLASGGSDSTVRLWDPARGQELRTMGDQINVARTVSAYFSPDGKLIAVALYDGSIALWGVTP